MGVAIEGHAAPVDLGGVHALIFRIGHVDPHDDGVVVADEAVAAEGHAVAEAGEGEVVPSRREEQAEADAREEQEHQRRAEKDDQRDRRGGEQERRADHAARAEDALDLDALRRRIVGVLDQEVLLHLAAEVMEDHRPGGGDHVAEEEDRVVEIGVERRAGDEHQERQDVDPGVVARRAPGEQLGDGEKGQEVRARDDPFAVGVGGEQGVAEGGEGGGVPPRGPALGAREWRLPEPAGDHPERAEARDDGRDLTRRERERRTRSSDHRGSWRACGWRRSARRLSSLP